MPDRSESCKEVTLAAELAILAVQYKLRQAQLMIKLENHCQQALSLSEQAFAELNQLSTDFQPVLSFDENSKLHRAKYLLERSIKLMLDGKFISISVQEDAPADLRFAIRYLVVIPS